MKEERSIPPGVIVVAVAVVLGIAIGFGVAELLFLVAHDYIHDIDPVFLRRLLRGVFTFLAAWAIFDLIDDDEDEEEDEDEH